MHGLSFTFKENDEKNYAILFVYRPENLNFASVRESIYSEFRKELEFAKAIVIREPCARPLPENSFIDEESKRDLLVRNFGLPIHILGSRDYSHVLSENINGNIESPISQGIHAKLIDQLRNAELTFFVESSGALLEVSENAYFRAPSGKYCKSFLRVGSVQTKRIVLDAFFFWLLPWLKDSDAIVTETWTISSLALNAGRLLARYDTRRDTHCRVDMLSQYHDESSTSLVSATSDVLRRVSTIASGNIVVLISSCMSGKLFKELSGHIKLAFLPMERFRFKTLYSLGNGHGLDALCDLSVGRYHDLFSFRDQPPDAASHSIVDIDSVSYFPLRIEARTHRIHAGNSPSAVNGRTLLDRYKKRRFVCVHRDARNLSDNWGRHHAIYLDVLTILEDEDFKNGFYRKLGALRSLPSLIVSPPHRAGVKMAEIAVAWFTEERKHSVQSFVHPDLGLNDSHQGSDEIKRKIAASKPSDSILIIDDVSISGSRLKEYQKNLRDLNFLGRVDIIVGVARPESDKLWKDNVQHLTFRAKSSDKHTLQYVEYIILPDWTDQKCPWCEEGRTYSSIVGSGNVLPALLAERHQRLNRLRRESGLVDELFIGGENFNPLSPNSIFIGSGATHAAIFASVASSLQRMRVKEETALVDETAKVEEAVKVERTATQKPYLRSQFPDICYLDPKVYAGEWFSEPAIKASVLRAATRLDLSSPVTTGEIDRKKLIDEFLNTSPNAHLVTIEFFLAYLNRKLPEISPPSCVSEQEYVDIINLFIEHSRLKE